MNTNGIEYPQPVCSVYLPEEIWFTILARVLDQEIHQVLTLKIDPTDAQFRILLLVCKMFRNITRQLILFGFGISRDLVLDENITAELVLSMAALYDWMWHIKFDLSHITKAPVPSYRNSVETPLLEAYVLLFSGKVAMGCFSPGSRTSYPRPPEAGERFTSALQLCRHTVRPVELCQKLLDDIFEALQHTHLLNILQDSGEAIVEGIMTYCREANVAHPDTSKLLELEQYLESLLNQIENCEISAAETLKTIAVPPPTLTRNVIRDSRLEDVLSLYKTHVHSKLGGINRLVERWGDLMEDGENLPNLTYP